MKGGGERKNVAVLYTVEKHGFLFFALIQFE